jgi:hypothetical protein
MSEVCVVDGQAQDVVSRNDLVGERRAHRLDNDGNDGQHLDDIKSGNCFDRNRHGELMSIAPSRVRVP